MFDRFAFRAGCALAVAVILSAFTMAQSQAARSSKSGAKSQTVEYQGPVGGYSLTRRDIFGLQKMPKTPDDFGPNFDMQAQPFKGGVNQAPYMH